MALASLALLVGAAWVPAASRADVIVDVSGSGNEFGTLDINTGVFTRIGTLNTTGTVYGLGFTSGGQLNALDSGGEAYKVNTTTAATTDLGNTGTSPSGAGGNGGAVLYSFDYGTNSLFSYNPTTKAVVTIGTYPGIGFSDGLIAVGPGGFVYITDGAPANDELYKINVTTGAITDVGSVGAGVGDFFYSGVFVGSTLYGFGSSGTVYTINTTTGAATAVSTYNLGGDVILGSAYLATVPEPSSVALMGLGLFGAATIARARRRRPIVAAG